MIDFNNKALIKLKKTLALTIMKSNLCSSQAKQF